MKTTFLQLATMSILGAMFTAACSSSINDTPKKAGAPLNQWVVAPGASEFIHQMTEMNTSQIRALPRERTAVILSGSYIGQHGPYLPSVDCFRNERLARELSHAIVQKPGWHVVMFPFIPLGQGSLEEFGARTGLHPAFVVRAETLRSIFMDLASHIGEQGFRWIFVIHAHGAPHHLHALDLAADYFHDMYGGDMVHLTGLLGLEQLDIAAQPLMSEAERNEDGLGIHANMIETSEALFLRPDLVNSAYKDAPAWTLRSIEDIGVFAAKEDWPGYFGSPRLAKAALGETILKEYSAGLNKLALEILDGRDYRSMTRVADEILKAIPPDTLKHELALAKKQEDWMKRKDRVQERSR